MKGSFTSIPRVGSIPSRSPASLISGAPAFSGAPSLATVLITGFATYLPANCAPFPIIPPTPAPADSNAASFTGPM